MTMVEGDNNSAKGFAKDAPRRGGSAGAALWACARVIGAPMAQCLASRRVRDAWFAKGSQAHITYFCGILEPLTVVHGRAEFTDISTNVPTSFGLPASALTDRLLRFISSP